MQTTETFTYDAVGNRLTEPGYTEANTFTQSYSYDYENRIKTITKQISGDPNTDTVTFKYDPFGRRIEKNVSTYENNIPTTYKYTYVYDNEDIILEIEEKTQSGNTTTTTTAYTHGPGIDEPLSLERGGQRYYYHADGLGSITSITDASQAVVNRYAYDSFGAVKKSETIRNAYAFTGREFDSETGLYYYRARYYDPEVGRFVSKDPIGFAGGDVNVFGYVGNGPINRIDPLGLYSLNDFMKDLTSVADIRLAQKFWEDYGGPVGYSMSGLISLSGLLTVQESAETLGDECKSTGEKIWAGTKIVLVGLSWYMGPLGKEISFGKNLRFAPFGNRTGGIGELPHYHRRIVDPLTGNTIPGGGIGWHRPWQRGF